MDTGYSKFYRGREALCVGLHPQLYIHMWHEAFSEANRSCLSECMSNQWGDPKSGKHAHNNKPDRDRRKKMRANSCAASADNWAMGERE
jgi:hypothetical protein